MEALIWLLVIVSVLVIIILTVITSVGKLSNKFVDKYVKTNDPPSPEEKKDDEDKELKKSL